MKLDNFEKWPLITALVGQNFTENSRFTQDSENEWLRSQLRAIQVAKLKDIKPIADELENDLKSFTSHRKFKDQTAGYVASKMSSRNDVYVVINLNSLLLFLLMSDNTDKTRCALPYMSDALLNGIARLSKLAACRAPQETTNMRNVLERVYASTSIMDGAKRVAEQFQVYTALFCPKQLQKLSEENRKGWENSTMNKLRTFLETVGEVFDAAAPGLGSCIAGAPTGTKGRAIYIPRPFVNAGSMPEKNDENNIEECTDAENPKRRKRKYVHWWKQLPVCITLPECMARDLLCRCIDIGGGMSQLRWTREISREKVVATTAAEMLASREDTNTAAMEHTASRGSYHIWMI